MDRYGHLEVLDHRQALHVLPDLTEPLAEAAAEVRTGTGPVASQVDDDAVLASSLAFHDGKPASTVDGSGEKSRDSALAVDGVNTLENGYETGVWDGEADGIRTRNPRIDSPVL